MNSLFDAVRLLTVIPVPAGSDRPQPSMSCWFSLVGAGVAGILAGAHAAVMSAPGINPAGGMTASAALTVALWLILTRAFHMDGVGDTFDALVSIGDREKKLEIMRDPRVGAAGAAAAALVVVAKILAIRELGEFSTHRVAAALFCAATTARATAAVACAIFPYAREDGLGAALIGRVTVGQAAVAALTAAPFVAIGGSAGGAAALGGCAAGFAVAVTAHRAFRGITGDVLGAVIEISECAALLAFLAFA